MAGKPLVYRAHALQRMFERGISAADVRDIVDTGRAIEDYPYPSRLVLGWRGGRPIHVVAATNSTANEIIVITVYEPDPNQWSADMRTRTNP